MCVFVSEKERERERKREREGEVYICDDKVSGLLKWHALILFPSRFQVVESNHEKNS